MWENSGDKKVFNGHVFTCMRVVSEKREAERLAGLIRDGDRKKGIPGRLARVTLRSKKYYPKEPAGSYFAGHGGFTVTTYCVWQGPKR